MSYICIMELTEQKIIDSAIIIFNDDLSASLETVAEKAGVTRRTLHRYFKDRPELVEACKGEMLTSCKAAMAAAYASSGDPLEQLEAMLYAGIDCGYKYAFLKKLYQRPEYGQIYESKEGLGYDDIKAKWRALVDLLQGQGVISKELTIAWVFVLFDGMINITIDALRSGDVARNDIKRFAWYSFSRSIGITSHPVDN
ncbi:TetR/AcrR family transcriptional regulator [Rufibacter hautae]|nr:TetR/AcrR family transcriptional regulator [Rufibacter hautae]